MNAIRQIATSLRGPYVAFAEFKRVVHVWDVVNKSHIRTMDTTLDFGGRRIAISSDGRLCVIGAYHVCGVAVYSIETGLELWRRKELKRVQRFSILADGKHVFCGFDTGPGELVNLQNGESQCKLRGVRDIYLSPFENFRLECRDVEYYALCLSPGEKTLKIPRLTFAALDVAFSSEHFCITESGGPVRCICTKDGSECWRYVPKNGEHVLTLAYSEPENCYYGILYAYERCGKKQLIRFDSNNGKYIRLADIGSSCEEAFCQNGTRLVDACGRIWDCQIGKVICTLPFSV